MITPPAPLPPIAAFTPDEYVKLKSGPTAWLLKPILPLGGAALMYGTAKAGKSCLAMQIALAVATGASWLNLPPVEEARPVLYAQFDNPRSTWQERTENLRRMQIIPEGLGTLHLLDRESAPYPFNILDPTHAEAFRQLVRTIDPALVVVDTLREAYRGDEDKSSMMQQVLSTFTLVCRPAALLYVHHGKKLPSDTDQEHSLMDGGRGSSYIPGAVDTVLSLRARDKRGTLVYQGRAVAETTTKLNQHPESFLWHLRDAPVKVEDAFTAMTRMVMEDAELESDRARATKLAVLSGKTFDQCRHAVRAAKDAVGVKHDTDGGQ